MTAEEIRHQLRTAERVVKAIWNTAQGRYGHGMGFGANDVSTRYVVAADDECIVLLREALESYAMMQRCLEREGYL